MTTTIYAHRGASKVAPENTLAAFELAYESGAEGIETDVQLTKDNVPILIHDERVDRTTDGKGYVKDYTYDQLQQLDAGSWFSKKYSGATIISLDQFLQWIQYKPILLNIELKNKKITYKNLESIVFEMIASYQLQKRTIISTFNPTSVQHLHRVYSGQVEIALITSLKRKKLVNYAKELGANALHIKSRLLERKLINQCKRENLTLRTYTINRQKQMIKNFAAKCDGIFTDIPSDAINIRNKFQSKKKKSFFPFNY